MFPPKPIVFVSSTIDDLPEERKAAFDAITKLKCVPRMSDFTFEAMSKGAITACIDEVKKSDFYILILGCRYGSELPNGISITEFEFDTAFKERKPIFIFDTSYQKELKQSVFENKVGSLFIYKKVTNPQQLETEIVRAFNKYFEEQQYQKELDKETLYSDLLEVLFPEKIFHASLNFDRVQVIKKTRGTERPLKMDAETRHVIYAALKQNSVPALGDFNYSEGKIITFQNLHDDKNPLSKIVDPGTIESDNAVDYFTTNNDYLNTFKGLLHQCLVRKFFSIGVQWQHELSLFYFPPSPETPDKRMISWHSKKDATRTVFEATYKTNKPDEMLIGKHLALRTRFFLFEGKWYLGIFPEWYFSYDGVRKSFYSARQIIYLKKKERNNQVFNHLKFLVFALKFYSPSDLFKQYHPYEILKFGKILNLAGYPSIDDNLWHPKEDKEIANLYLDKEIPVNISLDL